MSYPDRVEGTRLCIVAAADGVRVYGNPEAFRSLANWMSWIADANPSDHYECHTRFHMSSEATVPNVWVLLDERIASSFSQRSKGESDFELTFMAVEERDLDNLLEHQAAGILPKEWFDDDA
jgi:hypothetical protein